ncbi:MAG: hypothetical protein ORN83_15750 [Chthoniobacteraceae bacterium]|nr:hypothetical protein [Chthoniobacteraceae bacterium]
MTVKVICKSMNSKKVGVAIIFALLATQLILTLKSYVKDQAAGAEFSKQIESSKAESQAEREKRYATEKEASEAKANVALLSEQNTHLKNLGSELKSRNDIQSKLLEKLDLEAAKLKAQIRELELSLSKKDTDLASAKQAELKAAKEAKETEARLKAREANLLSQIESLEKVLDEKNQRLEAAKRALNNTQSSK